MPASIGKYRVERELGRGASGTVYLAHDSFREVQVAIKMLHPHLLVDPAQATRYRRMLHNEAALDYAKTQGLVHRDIKPANLLLQADGEVKLTDFGTALALHGEATHLSGLVGSPAYMSPEQIREVELTHLSDMFSLGIVLYELLTGHKPFQGESEFTTIFKISSEAPTAMRVLRPALPAALDAVVSRALAKNPQDRFPSWRDFGEALVGINRSLPHLASQSMEAVRFQLLREMDFFTDFSDVAIWESLRKASTEVQACFDKAFIKMLVHRLAAANRQLAE